MLLEACPVISLLTFGMIHSRSRKEFIHSRSWRHSCISRARTHVISTAATLSTHTCLLGRPVANADSNYAHQPGLNVPLGMIVMILRLRITNYVHRGPVASVAVSYERFCVLQFLLAAVDATLTCPGGSYRYQSVLPSTPFNYAQ